MGEVSNSDHSIKATDSLSTSEGADRSIWEQIDQAIAKSYEEVALERGIGLDTVHHSRNCEFVVDKIAEKLQQSGISVRRVHYGGWEITAHEFLCITLEDEWVVDPTWQQFLEHPNPTQPTVLKVKKTELSTVLVALGIPERYHSIWEKALDLG